MIDGAITFVSDKIKVQKENTAMVAIMIPFILMIMMGGTLRVASLCAYCLNIFCLFMKRCPN